MATLTKGKTFTNGELVTPANLHQMVDSATVANIVNADIAANAAIADTKLAIISTANKVAQSAVANLTTDLAGKAATSHTHDDRYYTETEMNTLLNGKQASGSYAAATHNHDASEITTGTLANSSTTATNANTANCIVARDGSGNFEAEKITAFEFRTPTSSRSRASGIIDATANGVSANYLDINIGSNASQAAGLTFGSAQSGTTIARFRTYDLFGLSVTTIGSITATGTSTQATGVAYNTTSDYRLKTNAEPLTNAVSRLSQIPVYRFHFIGAESGVKTDGFFAHEAQAIVPESVTGTKDGHKTEEYEVTPAVKDENGEIVTPAVMGTRTVPDYQGIDQSKLVPLLVAAVQELAARVAALESR